MAVLRYWLWLTLKPGIGNQKIHQLLDRFSTPEKIYQAERKDFEACDKLLSEDVEELCNKSLTKAEEIFNRCQDKQIKILTRDHELYPKLLLSIPDPPYVLYARYAERINLNEHLTVAVVGTRKATRYGLTTAEKLSGVLARQGITVVSGMALGNDAAAHWGALSGGGKTVAVLAGGVDKPSPPSHAKLMREIIKNGMVLSEYPPGTPSLPHHFRDRNRIISGLSRGTVVVEAPEGSGALITARHALAQDRDVFVVPADITSSRSVGSNQWLAQGAIPVLGPLDVFRTYEHTFGDVMEKNRPASDREQVGFLEESPEPKKKRRKSKEKPAKETIKQKQEKEVNKPCVNLSEDENAVLSLLSKEPKHIDELAAFGYSPAMLSATLVTLEMKGLVQAMPGKRFCLL